MASTKKQIFAVNFLKPGIRKNELLSRLNELWETLKTISQEADERPEGLQITATQLVSDRILRSDDKDIRLLACCCLVDVLRIFAPQAPFDDDDMIEVFEILTRQLRGLVTSDPTTATGSKICFILDSLSTVKSCVVPVIMMQSGVSGAKELVSSLFDTLVNTIRVDHSDLGNL